MSIFKSRPIQSKRQPENLAATNKQNADKIKRIKAFVSQPTPNTPVPLYQQLYRRG